MRKKTTVKRFLPDFVYGANDGLITTFAIVAGVAGAGLSNSVVLILGFASLLADGFSMATSDYLAERTPSDQHSGSNRAPAMKHGLATFIGFVTPGVVPLIAYLIPISDEYRFPLAGAMTLVTLFVVGAGRGLVATLPPWRAGAEMLVVGALAAAVAYGVGVFGSLMTGGGAMV
ncbi:VIT1/CCC1 transporter family protein [Marinobacter salicampi]|uniref:VIT1/CCC1 transporter family protein n=1 Tax=Marinobacter salicampi TaxID=435907 RepID=UPI001A95233D|nr:VIT1/CCC1 transporter family protein [Marinobacter salicampi]